MIRDWESTLREWGRPPSKTEVEKADHAESAVRKAIDACAVLQSRRVEVFAQGSYRNRTNVPQESDVDICVRCLGTFFYDLSRADGLTAAEAGIVPATYHYPQFKNDVGEALAAYFKTGDVTRGNKAFDIRSNTYRVDADVVAAFEHRVYYRTFRGGFGYHSGTMFLPDNGGEIINWPQQNYDNGVTKNQATGERFKAMVRVLENLRNEMAEQGIEEAEPIPSFLIECLVWNVPNEGFNHDTYRADLRWVLAYLYNETRRDETCKDWGEINQFKGLFHTGQRWTRVQVHDFLDAAWDDVGFE